jgi:hypothetical protein
MPYANSAQAFIGAATPMVQPETSAFDKVMAF